MIYHLPSLHPFVPSEVEGQTTGAMLADRGASTALGTNGVGEVVSVTFTSTPSCRARADIHPSSIPSAGEFAARWTPAHGRGYAAFAEIVA